jgi:plastocyanin
LRYQKLGYTYDHYYFFIAMNKAILILIAVVAIGGIIFIYNGNRAPEGGEAMTPPPPVNVLPPTVTPPADNPPASEVKTFTVTGQNFSFAPATLTVKKGDTVRIVFKNTSGFHDLKIDEFKVATKQIQGGQEETVEFIADKAGSFEYYCSVGNHRAMGMQGTLVVQ